jgi:hypothetical protein
MDRRNFLKASGLFVAAGLVLPKAAKSMLSHKPAANENFSLEVITGNSDLAVKLLEEFAKDGSLGNGSISYSEYPLSGNVIGDLIFVQGNNLIDYTRSFDDTGLKLREIRNKLSLPSLLNNPVRIRLYRNESTDLRNIIVTHKGNIISKLNPDNSGLYTFNGKSGKMVIDVSGNSVKVKDTECRHKICRMMNSIRKPGDYITCIPNELHIFAE